MGLLSADRSSSGSNYRHTASAHHTTTSDNAGRRLRSCCCCCCCCCCGSHLSLSLIFIVTVIIILTASTAYVSSVVVYQVRFINTNNGRTDYALAGESIELSCHYLMKDEAEDIKQIIWSKDGKNFLKWRKNKPGLDVLSYTFKGHIDPTSKHSHIIIHNVTIDMHGKYKCSVKTDLGSREMEQELIVISQSNCKLDDWRITSQANECRETIKFDCRNMFPKPVTSCGLWNSKLDKFIRSVMVDISEEPNKPTFRIKYSGKFELPPPSSSSSNLRQVSGKNSTVNDSNNNNNNNNIGGLLMNDDLLQYAGYLTFKCDIVVPETSWRLSLIYRMFDYNEGCLQDPLDTIEKMRFNYSHYATTRMQQAGYFGSSRDLDDFEMLTSNLKYELLSPIPGKPVEADCWHKPKIGSMAKLSCANKANQARLVGANLLECRPEGWVPVAESLNKKNFKKQTRPRKLPPQTRQNRSSNSSDTSQTAKIIRFDDDRDTSDLNANSQLSDTNYNNDLGLLPSPTIVTETSTLESTSSQPLEIEFIPTNQKILSDLSVESQSITELVQPSTLTPAQLAALLPTCVSTRRSHISSIVSNRLPLLDEAHILESSSPINSQRDPNLQNRNKNNVDKSRTKFNSLFNFSSSGSSSETFKTTTHGKEEYIFMLAISLTTLIGLIINMREMKTKQLSLLVIRSDNGGS